MLKALLMFPFFAFAAGEEAGIDVKIARSEDGSWRSISLEKVTLGEGKKTASDKDLSLMWLILMPKKSGSEELLSRIFGGKSADETGRLARELGFSIMNSYTRNGDKRACYVLFIYLFSRGLLRDNASIKVVNSGILKGNMVRFDPSQNDPRALCGGDREAFRKKLLKNYKDVESDINKCFSEKIEGKDAKAGDEGAALLPSHKVNWFDSLKRKFSSNDKRQDYTSLV